MISFYEILSIIKRVISGSVTEHKEEALPHTNITKLSFDTTPETTTLGVGEIKWNPDEICLDVGEPNGGILQVGQEFRAFAKNRQGAQINEGQVVFVSGASGSNIEMQLADASTYNKAICTIAVATENIADNTTGRFTTMGFVRGLNTSAWNEGDTLFLSSTPGQLTTVLPTYPNEKVKIATVTRSNPTVGEIYVRIISMPRKFGDPMNGNYTGFEDDGTMVANGNATTYDDMLGELLGKSLESPSAKIVQNLAEGSIVFKTTATTADYVVLNIQLSHRWEFGSAIHPHLHWIQSQNSLPNWLIQYRWQRNGEAKTTAWTNAKYTTNAFTYVSGNLNQITTFPEITPPADYSISDVVQIRLIRDTTNLSGLFTGADLYTVDAHAYYFDVHIETDTLGSRQEYVK